MAAGQLSNAQIEAVVYAFMRFDKRLQNGESVSAAYMYITSSRLVYLPSSKCHHETIPANGLVPSQLAWRGMPLTGAQIFTCLHLPALTVHHASARTSSCNPVLAKLLLLNLPALLL